MVMIPDLLTLLQSGVHFGHQLSKRHPKMMPYIFTAKNGVHVINLEETQRKLTEALEYVSSVAANGGTILFLGTKKQAQAIVKAAAVSCGMPHVTERWLGGTFTNFGTVSKLIIELRDLKQKRDSGELEKYTKKEQLEFSRKIEKLEKVVGGLSGMNKIPDAVFIVDTKHEKTGLQESNRKHVPIVAMCDTNVNPEVVDYPIPANDDAVKSITLITNLVAEAVREGQAKAQSAKAAATPVALSS